LIRVLDGSNQVAEYTYNGAGQRIKKVTQTETRIFHYDQIGHLIAETNQTGEMLAEYVYLGDQLLAMIKPSELVYYYHNDHLGTPQVLTDDAQTIAWKAVYTPFGDSAVSIQTVENPFRFPGQYYDPETGLHYNYFRYYNPQTGRYITPDPIRLWGGINLFSYVANSPLNKVDPWGLYIGQMPPPPPGYNPSTWGVSQWDNGLWVLKSPNGRIYTAHPEDTGHWRHWGIQGPGGKDEGDWPSNPGKRKPGQKKLKPHQCDVDPSGNTPGWMPPMLFFFVWPSFGIPVIEFSPAPVPAFGF
jgi:RHS repeat-associated protein